MLNMRNFLDDIDHYRCRSFAVRCLLTVVRGSLQENQQRSGADTSRAAERANETAARGETGGEGAGGGAWSGGETMGRGDGQGEGVR